MTNSRRKTENVLLASFFNFYKFIPKSRDVEIKRGITGIEIQGIRWVNLAPPPTSLKNRIYVTIEYVIMELIFEIVKFT